jgi:hypothetical protein
VGEREKERLSGRAKEEVCGALIVVCNLTRF